MSVCGDGRTAAEIDEMLDRFRGSLPGLKLPDRSEWDRWEWDRPAVDERDDHETTQT
jgi:hypothetical protein